MSKAFFLSVLLFATIFGVACSNFSRIVPGTGSLREKVGGVAAELRVHTLLPNQLPDLPGIVAVFVELRNTGRRSLRIAYPDLWIGNTDRHVGPLRPGDVLRPTQPGARKLLASLSPGTLFGRKPEPQKPLTPETLSDWNTSGSSLDFFSPTTRTRSFNLWIMRNDYDSGMHLTTEGWPFFGLPRSGDGMSFFDILQATLPDGSLLPGGAQGGILFFPREQVLGTGLTMHWDVYDALSDEKLETLSLPVSIVK